jgi:hypothetical protein
MLNHPDFRGSLFAFRPPLFAFREPANLKGEQPEANREQRLLALTLLVFRILADHPHYSLAVDDLALIANLLYRCSNLHNQFPVLSSQLPILSKGNCRSFAPLGMTIF